MPVVLLAYFMLQQSLHFLTNIIFNNAYIRI